MKGFEGQRQEWMMKRRWQIETTSLKRQESLPKLIGGGRGLLDDDVNDLVSSVVPAVTVVLEGRSICHRISLHKHASYQSLARALRNMFVDSTDSDADVDPLDLSNAVPGHVVAYEDFENDLLLAGDLNWRDFVRVAKRIRILPAKANSRRKGRSGNGLIN